MWLLKPTLRSFTQTKQRMKRKKTLFTVKYQPSNNIFPEKSSTATRIISSHVKWYQACACLQVSFLKRAAMWSGLSKLVLIWVSTSMFSTTSFCMDTNIKTVSVTSNCGYMFLSSNYPFRFFLDIFSTPLPQ